MSKYINGIGFPGGLRILAGQPIDDRLQFNTITDFIAFIDTDEYKRLYDGIVITIDMDIYNPSMKNTTRFIWKESAFGALFIGKPYGKRDIIGGIDYRGKTYNLVLFEDSANVAIQVLVDSLMIEIPIAQLPYKAVIRGVYSVTIFENSDKEETVPDKVIFNATSNMLEIHVLPEYPKDTILNIKIN